MFDEEYYLKKSTKHSHTSCLSKKAVLVCMVHVTNHKTQLHWNQEPIWPKQNIGSLEKH